MTSAENQRPHESDNIKIEVLNDLIDTQITFEDGTRARLFMNERMVARVILAYRSALETLRESRKDKR